METVSEQYLEERMWPSLIKRLEEQLKKLDMTVRDQNKEVAAYRKIRDEHVKKYTDFRDKQAAAINKLEKQGKSTREINAVKQTGTREAKVLKKNLEQAQRSVDVQKRILNDFKFKRDKLKHTLKIDKGKYLKKMGKRGAMVLGAVGIGKAIYDSKKEAKK